MAGTGGVPSFSGVTSHSATGALPRTIRRPLAGPLLGFFAAAYLLPWAVWGSRIAQDHGRLGWHLPGAIVGVMLLVVGVILLDTSPLVQRVQRIQDAVQRQASEPGAGR